MKTICIYHSRDLDGWMCAAIVKEWFTGLDVGMKGKVYCDLPKEYVAYHETEAYLHFLGWDYGDVVPVLDEYTDIIMCDISFPPKEMLKIQLSGKGFIWNDHHVSAINGVNALFNERDVALPFGIRDTKFAACELTWKDCFPEDTMPEIVRLLGRYDCFGHKGTDEEQEVLEFQYGARQAISGYNDAFYNLECWIKNDRAVMDAIPLDGAAIYRYLHTEAKQIYKRAFPIIFKEDNNGIGPFARKFLCVNQERFNPINFGIDYHKDGYDGFACFGFNKGQWTFSLYNDNGEVDCSVIAQSFGGGGHKGASGFVVSDLGSVLTIMQPSLSSPVQ